MTQNITQNMTKNIIDTIKLNNNDLIKLVFAKKSICSKNNNFITNTNIFDNIKDMIQNIESKLKENNIKYIITTETFIREQYYSQICDRLEKSENIYTEDLKLIDKFSDKNSDTDIFIFKSDIYPSSANRVFNYGINYAEILLSYFQILLPAMEFCIAADLMRICNVNCIIF